MLNFLMVSTVFSKKQFTILSLKEKSELNTLTEYAKGRNHDDFFRIRTKEGSFISNSFEFFI